MLRGIPTHFMDLNQWLLAPPANSNEWIATTSLNWTLSKGRWEWGINRLFPATNFLVLDLRRTKRQWPVFGFSLLNAFDRSSARWMYAISDLKSQRQYWEGVIVFRWGSKGWMFTFLLYPPLIFLDCKFLLVCLQEDVCPGQLIRQGDQTWNRQRFEVLKGFSPNLQCNSTEETPSTSRNMGTGSTNDFCLLCFEKKIKLTLALLPLNSVPCYNNRQQNSLFKFS